jgi:hypothetical protein
MPADDLVLNVRQIAGYPATGNASSTASLLMQLGLGGAYVSISPQALVGTALANGGDMAIAGSLSVQAISGGSAQFSNGMFGMVSAQKACLVDLAATFGTLGGVQIATLNDLSNVDAAIRAASVWSFNGRVGDVRLWIDDIRCAGGAPIYSPRFEGSPRACTPPPTSNSSRLATTAYVTTALGVAFEGFAPLDSPNFIGVPTAPTAPQGSADGQLATTAFVTNAVAAATAGVASFNGRTGVVSLVGGDITAAGGALLASPVFTGTPSAPTQPTTDNSTRLATTAFVQAFAAPLASPAFTGVPTGPTAPPSTSTTQLATTAFVTAAIAAGVAGTVTTFNGRSGAVNLIGNDVSAAGGALTVSPAFTGTPTAPTAAPSTSNTQLATCAFVMAAVATGGGVLTFNGRAGTVTLTAADLSGVGGALLASPAFTGSPTAPTAAPGSNTAQLATCAFVQAAISAGTAGVASFNTRTGAVSLIATDVTAVLPASTSTPLMNGAASPGAQAAWARGDHIHPVDTSRYAATNPSNFQTAAQVTASLANYLPLTGGTLTGVLTATGLTSTGNLNVSNQCSVTNGGTIGSVTLQGGQLLTGGATAWALSWNANPTGFGTMSVATDAAQGYMVRSVPTPDTTWGVTLLQLQSALTSMYVVGDNAVTAGWSTTASDGRLKANLAAPARDALALVNGVAVSQCDFRHPAAPGGEHWDFTIVAQDIEAVLPYAYMPAPQDGYSGLHPLHLITVLWKAVQQLSERLAALEARIA